MQRPMNNGYAYGFSAQLMIVPVENGWEICLPNLQLVPEDFDPTKDECLDPFRTRIVERNYDSSLPSYENKKDITKSVKYREQKMSEAKDSSRMFFKYSELEEMIAFLRTKLV